jgi:hypothetical protein
MATEEPLAEYGNNTDSLFSKILFLPSVNRNLCTKYSMKHCLLMKKVFQDKNNLISQIENYLQRGSFILVNIIELLSHLRHFLKNLLTENALQVLTLHLIEFLFT